MCNCMYGKARSYGTGVHIWYQGDSYMHNGHKKSENGSWQQMWPASCWLHVRVNKSWATTRSLTHDVYVAHSQWCDHTKTATWRYVAHSQWCDHTKTDTWRLRCTFSRMRTHEDWHMTFTSHIFNDATTRRLTHDVYVAHSQWCDHTKTWHMTFRQCWQACQKGC